MGQLSYRKASHEIPMARRRRSVRCKSLALGPPAWTHALECLPARDVRARVAAPHRDALQVPLVRAFQVERPPGLPKRDADVQSLDFRVRPACELASNRV